MQVSLSFVSRTRLDRGGLASWQCLGRTGLSGDFGAGGNRLAFLDDCFAPNYRHVIAGRPHDCVLSNLHGLGDDHALKGGATLNARVVEENRIANHGSIRDRDTGPEDGAFDMAAHDRTWGDPTRGDPSGAFDSRRRPL
jgi:hypothetical protein